MICDPCVGIFWGIRGFTDTCLVTDKSTLSEAEIYGEFLTHPRGHYEFWEKLRRKGAAFLKKQGWPLQILSYEYEEWPRGRIVFNTTSQYFTLYADRKLQHPHSLTRIINEFGLDAHTYEVKSDPHYRSSQSL
ncbi:hypothetical protein FS320_02190 [Microvirga tunisiensis]|uniref:Uncharacterized protein n=1 Tax=Microvirga tunisiensis TaxID=2108360 RepID=A0A5N7MAV9_9HYPH|nr:hypothetical protein [Microvirga tunisiensis]MPR24061.1 hypothetical protein [Microvirga tunisiensis]